MSEGLITISIDEYEKLVKDHQILNALESYGVENWEGFWPAVEGVNDEQS